MLTSQNYDYDEATFAIEENEADKVARLNRLRVADIKRRLKAIDNERIRPLAAIVSGHYTGVDTDKLTMLESEAQALRDELSELEV